MTWTLDRSTDTGMVRVLVTGEAVEATAVFADEDLAVLLAIGGHVLIASAMALERIAGDQVLLFKKLTVGSIELDGPAVAASFLALAARYRGAYENSGSAADDILIAGMVVNEGTWAETFWADVLRTTA